MNKNVKPTTPRCGICQSFYSTRDDDGSGLCLKCRPADSQPLLNIKHQLKQTFVMGVSKTMMDDFDQEELKEQEEGLKTEENQEKTDINQPVVSTEDQVAVEVNTGELKIEDIIEPGRYGVSNSQMIPAMKIAIAEKSLEKLALLKKSYLYTYNKSIRYLKKLERDYITNNDI
jgi:hypothetical protein